VEDIVTRNIITANSCSGIGRLIIITCPSLSVVIILATEVDVDWKLTAASRLWTRKYLLGQVPKAACHPEIRRINEDGINKSNYESVWGP